MNILDSEKGGHEQPTPLMNADIQPPVGETLEFALAPN